MQKILFLQSFKKGLASVCDVRFNMLKTHL